jgi:hypothetical protein
MRKFITSVLTVGILAVAAFSIALPTQAADPPQKEPAKKAKADKPVSFKGKVTTVDSTAKTITFEAKETSRTVQITSETRLQKAGKPATLDDVKVGDEIAGQVRKSAAGKESVVSLRIGPKPEGKRPKQEGEPKKEGGEKKKE